MAFLQRYRPPIRRDRFIKGFKKLVVAKGKKEYKLDKNGDLWVKVGESEGVK